MRRLVIVLLISGVALLVTGVAVIAASAQPAAFQMPPADTAYVGFDSCFKCHTDTDDHWNLDYPAQVMADVEAHGVASASDLDDAFAVTSEKTTFGPACASCHPARTTLARHTSVVAADAHAFNILVPMQTFGDAPETCTNCHNLELSTTPLPDSLSFAIRLLPDGVGK